MQIHCLGLNHTTASVALRERLAFNPPQLQAALARIRNHGGQSLEAIGELVILSTCNRVELYAVAPNSIFSTLENFISVTHQVPLIEFAQALYRFQNAAAVRHLLRVAAGLESMVLGEPQILGQITQAYSIAREYGTAGKLLSRLFQTAIQAGKRTRAETAICHNPASIASLAVKLLANQLKDLASAQVVVVGAGEMAQLTVEALRKRGVTHIHVLNRTLERARHLAERLSGKAGTLEALPALLRQADILITSTGALHPIIDVPMTREAMRLRSHRPLVIMDIAVPRDVDAGVRVIPGVSLYDVDSLADGLQESLAMRKAEIPKVEAILKEEQATFMQYLAGLAVVPIIVQMRKQADQIRQSELEKTMRRIPEITPEMKTSMDALTKAIVKKILHNPTIRLREEADGPNGSDYAKITRRLFGIE